MLISFVLCSHRVRGTLEKALTCIAAQNGKENWECLLVDNGFDPGEASTLLVKAMTLFSNGNFRCLREPTPGLGYARRTGFEHAVGDWIVMLDDDNYVGPNFAAELLRIIERYPEAGGVTPLVTAIMHSEPASWKTVVANRCLSVTEASVKGIKDLPRYYDSSNAALAPRPPGGGHDYQARNCQELGDAGRTRWNLAPGTVGQ